MSSTNDGPSDLTSDVLEKLSHNDGILSSEAFPKHSSTTIKASLDRLGSRLMVTYETIDREEAVLEPEAQEIESKGSHEARVFEALCDAVDGLTVSELEKAIGDKNVVKVGQGKAFKSKWIEKGKDGKLIASVSEGLPQNPIIILTMIDKINNRHHTRTTQDYPRYSHISGS